tara:strand:+ start:1128 stop:1610 length:483 start_codon:yes stop_codon:yes gene_type:complete
MDNLIKENELIKKILSVSKTIAMIGVSSIKEEDLKNVKRKPSIIVMKYMQEFGYKVIPVNPFSAGQEVNGEKIIANIKDIKIPIDIVDVFRPSKEALDILYQTIQVGAKTIWLQYGIHDENAKKVAEEKKINYISNKCIKQEYQKYFLKMNPVFPVLRNK